MLKVAELTGRKVLVHKKKKPAKDGADAEKYQRFGKVHTVVFYPGGKRAAGILVKRPDVVGMVKRDDAFLAWDSFSIIDDGSLLVSPGDGSLDERAIRRLGLDWDACIIWSGMDARTTDGKTLGYVNDAEIEEKTGRVEHFFTADSGMARALIGSFVITPDMVRGYSKGCMIVDPGDRAVELDGGLAAAAGEGYARAKAGASKVGKQVGEAAGKAVDKGSFALGKALGKAKRAIADATADDEEDESESGTPAVPAADVRVEKPTERIAEKTAEAPDRPQTEPKTYAPAGEPGAKPADGTGAKPSPASAATRASAEFVKPATKKQSAKTAAPAAKKKPATKKKPTTGEQIARAAGRQLGSLGKAFGEFKSEFDKASKE